MTVLVSEPKVPCPHCGTLCHVGVRGRGVLIAHCPPCGVFVTSQAHARPDAGLGRMHPEERLWLLESAITRFMIDPDHDDFMGIQSSTLACNQVLLRFGPEGFWMEVDCREWDCHYCGNRPLTAAALSAIGELGFRLGPGGPNPFLHPETRDPRALAVLADEAMLRAYGEAGDYELGISFQRAEVLTDVVAQLSAA